MPAANTAMQSAGINARKTPVARPGSNPRRQAVDENVLRDMSAPFYGTFPDDGDSPSKLPTKLHVPRIPGTVSLDLGPPEIPSCGGPFEKMTVMPMPEAPIDKNQGTVTGQDNIGRAGDIPDVEAEPVTRTVQTASDKQLGSGVSPPDARHHP